MTATPTGPARAGQRNRRNPPISRPPAPALSYALPAHDARSWQRPSHGRRRPLGPDGGPPGRCRPSDGGPGPSDPGRDDLGATGGRPASPAPEIRRAAIVAQLLEGIGQGFEPFGQLHAHVSEWPAGCGHRTQVGVDLFEHRPGLVTASDPEQQPSQCAAVPRQDPSNARMTDATREPFVACDRLAIARHGLVRTTELVDHPGQSCIPSRKRSRINQLVRHLLRQSFHDGDTLPQGDLAPLGFRRIDSVLVIQGDGPRSSYR